MQNQFYTTQQNSDPIVTKVSNQTGDAVFTCHEVFEGVKLIYNSVHMDKCNMGANTPMENIIEINHCKQGRIEKFVNGNFFYLSPGDLSLEKNPLHVQEEFPLRHYHGITILIDTQKAPRCFSCFIKDVDVRPIAIADKLCKPDGVYFARSQEYVEHIFSELYDVPQHIRKGYFKIKILELLLMLSTINPNSDKERTRSLSTEQVRLAKQIKEFLSQNMDKKITIAELSQKFFVSESLIKTAFKGVYGVPVFSFMRIQKMQCASIDLIHTDKSVTDIAMQYGYDNASKFSSAFKEVMGDTPILYRKEHQQYEN